MQGIQNIQVINLDRRADRWQEFVTESKRVGLVGYQRFSAVDGRAMTYNPNLKQIISSQNDFHWRCGVVGCILSHVRIWKEQVKNETPWTLVLEDDVTFKVNDLTGWWKQKCFDAFVKLNKVDLLYLGGCLQDDSEKDPRYKTRIGDGPFWTCSQEGWHLGAYAYLISLNGAQNLIKLLEQEPMDCAVDWWLIHRFHKLNITLIRPFLAHSPIGYKSDIQGHRESIQGTPDIKIAKQS